MVKLFEIDKQFAEMLREPQNFGLSDTEHACYGGGYVWKPFASRSAATDSRLAPSIPRSALPSPATPAGSGRRNAHGAPQCGRAEL